MKIAAVLVAIIVGLLLLPYPRYRREMQNFRTRLLTGSTMLKTDQGDLEYAVEGEGTSVLSLHGAGGGYDQGLWIAKIALGGGYKIISVSRYGYLRTPIRRSASIQTQAALYKDLLDRLGIPKVIVVGSSAGGPSAAQFANDYPERTSALILLSALSKAAAPGDKPPFYIGVIHLIERSDYAYWLVARFMQPAILNLMGIPGGVYARLTPAQKQLAQGMLDTMHPMSRRYWGTVNDGEMIGKQPPAFGCISAPTLILHAKDDALVSYRHAEYAHQAIRQSQLILFETGGHGLLAQMEAVRSDVRGFLSR